MAVRGRTQAGAPAKAPVALATAVALFSLAVVVAGGIVRVTGSGLGCPDWPLCYGRVVPPAMGAALIEFSHRMVAGVFALGVYLLALRCRRLSVPEPGVGVAARAGAALVRVAWLSAALVTVQAVLGGLNVLTELSPGVGGAHLLLAMVSVGMLTSAAALARVAARRLPEPRPRGGAAGAGVGLSWTAAALATLVVGIGAYVRALGASLACTDWPLCAGRVLPPAGWPFWLHWSHRVAALALGVVLVAGALRSGGGRRGWNGALALYGIQVLLGWAAVRWQLPAVVRVLHLGVAAVLVAILWLEATRAWVAAQAGEGHEPGSLRRTRPAAGAGGVPA